MDQIRKVAIIGAGSWGTAVAKNIAESKPHVYRHIWAYEKSVVSAINSFSENAEFLPGIKLPPNITATNSLKEAVEEPWRSFSRRLQKSVYDLSQKLAGLITGDMDVAFLTKGFCKIQNEVLTISQTIERAIPYMAGKVVAISGPEPRGGGLAQVPHLPERGRAVRGNADRHGPSARFGICPVPGDRRHPRRRSGRHLEEPGGHSGGMISALPRCGDNLAGALISEALSEMVRLGEMFGISRRGSSTYQDWATWSRQPSATTAVTVGSGTT